MLGGSESWTKSTPVVDFLDTKIVQSRHLYPWQKRIGKRSLKGEDLRLGFQHDISFSLNTLICFYKKLFYKKANLNIGKNQRKS